MENSRVLVLAPHTDDGEFGCGGSLAKLIESGNTVYYAAFSSCEKSLPPDAPKDTLKRELLEATKVLGVAKENVIMYDYPVREFPHYRQEILDDMVKLEREIKPSLVFMPSINDIHQDHMTVANECLRAFKKNSILGYELQWNNFLFHNQVFFSLEERHVKIKIAATKCYNSQNGRVYMEEDYIQGVMRSHGVQIGTRFAEVFEAARWVVK